MMPRAERGLFSLLLMMGLETTAHAHGGAALALPSVSAGTLPYRSYSGDVCSFATPLMTVPDGQDFIITMVASTIEGHSSRAGDWENGTRLLKDGELLLTGSVFSRVQSVTVSTGTGRLVVPSGSALSIQAFTESCGQYYLQGYLIEAGGPYRSYFGSSVGSGRTVMTVEAEKTFLVRTIAMSTRESPWHCHVWVDGAKVIDGETFAVVDRGAYDAGNPSTFPMGKGTLVLTGGQTLQMGPEDPTAETQCDYYVEGEYIEN